MDNPRAIGLPFLILGVLTVGPSVSSLLAVPSAWTSLAGLSTIAGTIGGLALSMIGISILCGWGDFAIDPDQTG